MEAIVEQLTCTIKANLKFHKEQGHRIWDEEDTNYVKWLKRKLKPFGFKYLACGLNRVVFLSKDGKYVLKVDKSREQNELEIENWKRIPDNIKHLFLAPVAWSEDYSWIIMPRVKIYRSSKADDIVDKMKKILSKKKIEVKDLHSENVGLTYDGVEVIIDYGFRIYGLPELH